jgi:hypothetical protein
MKYHDKTAETLRYRFFYFDYVFSLYLTESQRKKEQRICLEQKTAKISFLSPHFLQTYVIFQNNDQARYQQLQIHKLDDFAESLG